ncbi:hypothetical protein MNBD_GAMMA05-1471 [hydrothermal vent metagenome]|uniref:Acyltransferase 3 domain-containing protein n=1 Tax=hydrothermal vent metagenome TaxID=652676 RepID=A0A3B0X4G9_9ZZZZ
MIERNYRLDNVKYLLILFVVFGHLVEPLINQSAVFKVLWASIYSFHMPAFALISGVLSKPELSSSDIGKSIRTILIPFIAFTVLYEAYNLIESGHISGYSKKLQPYWILWFLYSLFIWRLMLPVLLKFRFPILLTVLVAVASGYFNSINYFLGVSRTLYFLPFFLIGYKLAPKILMPVSLTLPFKSILLAILIGNVLLFIVFNDASHEWMYGSYSFKRLGVHGWSAGGIRLALMTTSVLTILSILFLMPDKKIWCSERGRHSMHVYAWHGFLIKLFLTFGVITFIGKSSLIMALFILFVMSFIITYLLSSNFVSDVTQRYVLEPFQKFFIYKV